MLEIKPAEFLPSHLCFTGSKSDFLTHLFGPMGCAADRQLACVPVDASPMLQALPNVQWSFWRLISKVWVPGPACCPLASPGAGDARAGWVGWEWAQQRGQHRLQVDVSSTCAPALVPAACPGSRDAWGRITTLPSSLTHGLFSHRALPTRGRRKAPNPPHLPR